MPHHEQISFKTHQKKRLKTISYWCIWKMLVFSNSKCNFLVKHLLPKLPQEEEENVNLPMHYSPPPPKNTGSRWFYTSVISNPPGINHSLLFKCFKIIQKETSLPSIFYEVGILILKPGQNDIKIVNTYKELFVWQALL